MRTNVLGPGCAVALVPWLATAAQAADGSGWNGYEDLVWMVPLGGLAVLALIVFVMVKTGIGWLVKWIAVAALLAVVIPFAVIGLLHDQKRLAFEKRDFAGPLPLMAERTPLVIVSGGLSGCPRPVGRFIEAWAGKGVLVVTTWRSEEIDFEKPVALADLPLKLHAGGRTGKDTDAENLFKGYSYHVRTLTPDQRQAAAASIDYLIVAECDGIGPIYDAFRGNPALSGETGRFSVQLAMAPLERGAGLLSIRDLQFDLLDRGFLGVTEGFLFTGMRVGSYNTAPYDEALLAQSLCTLASGIALEDCP